MLLDLCGLADLLDDVGVVDDRGLLAVGGGVDVASAGVIGDDGLVGKRGGGTGGESGGCGGGACGLDKVAASEFHHVPLSQRDVCRHGPYAMPYALRQACGNPCDLASNGSNNRLSPGPMPNILL